MAQFDALLAILEPHIKRKTTSFCELCVQGSICALCCEMKWMNLTIIILDFGIRLYTDGKTQKIEPDPNFFYDGRKFRR